MIHHVETHWNEYLTRNAVICLKVVFSPGARFLATQNLKFSYLVSVFNIYLHPFKNIFSLLEIQKARFPLPEIFHPPSFLIVKNLEK